VLDADLLGGHVDKETTKTERRAKTQIALFQSVAVCHGNNMCDTVVLGRMIISRGLTPAPAREVPLTGAREDGVGAVMDLVSPALSTKVLRLGSGSLTNVISIGEMKGIHATYAVLASGA
jgi:hypothetical protein